MGSIEKYKKYFTKEYLMGPNSFRLRLEYSDWGAEKVLFVASGMNSMTVCT